MQSVFKGRVYVVRDNIDTDQIIPAEFLNLVPTIPEEYEKLGSYALYGLPESLYATRFVKPGQLDSEFPIVVAGKNFGCGSSREHAPQAIYRYGFRAVLAESFAEIFFGNCVTLGIPCAVAAAADMQRLREAVEKDPQLVVTVDVEKNRVFFGSENFTVNIPDTARDALTSGRWDPIADLLEGESAVAATAAGLDYMKA